MSSKPIIRCDSCGGSRSLTTTEIDARVPIHVLQHQQFMDFVACHCAEIPSSTISSSPSSSSLNKPLASRVPFSKVGHWFGPFMLVKTLGEGEFGKVKLAVHEKTNQQVAIKLVKKKNLTDGFCRSKLEHEMVILKTVRHPFIVNFYEAVETPEHIAIIMEYAPGGEMFDYIIKRGRLKEREAAKYFAQLISGVRYLHRNQIVHRDLKLENLLLDQHDNLIITDFGFAFSYLLPRHSRPDESHEEALRIHKKDENRTKNIYMDYLETSCGSPTYAAPELVMMDSYLGPPTDIWSCGIILYGMLAGYLPFDNDPKNPNGENVNLLYNFILRTTLEFPRWIPALPQSLISRMLVPDPMLRATMDEILRHEWLEPYDPYFDDEWLLKMMGDLKPSAPPSIFASLRPDVGKENVPPLPTSSASASASPPDEQEQEVETSMKQDIHLDIDSLPDITVVSPENETTATTLDALDSMDSEPTILIESGTTPSPQPPHHTHESQTVLEPTHDDHDELIALYTDDPRIQIPREDSHFHIHSLAASPIPNENSDIQSMAESEDIVDVTQIPDNEPTAMLSMNAAQRSKSRHSVSSTSSRIVFKSILKGAAASIPPPLVAPCAVGVSIGVEHDHRVSESSFQAEHMITEEESIAIEAAKSKFHAWMRQHPYASVVNGSSTELLDPEDRRRQSTDGIVRTVTNSSVAISAADEQPPRRSLQHSYFETPLFLSDSSNPPKLANFSGELDYNAITNKPPSIVFMELETILFRLTIPRDRVKKKLKFKCLLQPTDENGHFLKHSSGNKANQLLKFIGKVFSKSIKDLKKSKNQASSLQEPRPLALSSQTSILNDSGVQINQTITPLLSSRVTAPVKFVAEVCKLSDFHGLYYLNIEKRKGREVDFEQVRNTILKHLPMMEGHFLT